MDRQPTETGTPIDRLEEMAIGVVLTATSVVCMPLEILFRWKYGTRYFPVYVIFFTAGLLMLLSTFGMVASGVAQMIPFAHVGVSVEMFDMWSLTKLFFFLIFFVHGPRLWRRMVYTDMEQFSRFEGPSLPFYRLLPFGNHFNLVRIVMEPLTLVIVAFVLHNMGFITSGLAAYCYISALMLSMKCYCLWFRAWETVRNLLDIQNAKPLYARIADGTDTQQDREGLHLASLPKSPEERKNFVALVNARYGSLT